MDANSLQQVVGVNCRRIRTDHNVTQSQLASHARRLGLPWSASKCGDFEAGRNRVYADVLLLVSRALDNAVGQGHGATRHRPRVTLADLVQTDAFVELNPDLRVRGEALVKVCQGKPWEVWGGLDTDDDVAELLDDAPGALGEVYRMKNFAVADMRKRSTRTEARLAERLGITADHLLGLSWSLWKQPFSEKRDHDAGPSRGARAQATKQLTVQLQAELWKEQHGND